ncbi:MAG: tetratricopeptide repeat-containing sensor histidine kinase [Bacteroidales bacterium]
MKKGCILLLILLSGNIYPQERMDSLLNQLDTIPGQDRIEILLDLCWENRFSHPEVALKYGLEAMKLAKEYEAYEHEATINNYLGIIQRNVGNHAMALEYFFKAQRIAQEHRLMGDLAYAYNNIGDIQNMEGHYHEALRYELQALQIFEDRGDSLGVSYCCHQIALAYNNLNDYTRSLAYHRRAMNIRALEGNRAGVGYSLLSIGQTYLSLGDHAEALQSLNESQEIFSELRDSSGLCLSLQNLGLYFRETGMTEVAIHYFTEALLMGRKIGSQIDVRNTAQELSELYADQSRYKEAYQMYILFKETYDSLYREENLGKITQLVLQNEFEQKELLQQAEIDKQKQVRNYLILSIGLVVILVIVLLNRYSIKRKANIKLEKQKSELNDTLDHLTQAQTQLVQSEKMASLGQVTAGVAHELNNPLNFISSSVKPLRRNMEDLIAILEKYDSVIGEKALQDAFADAEEFKQAVDYSYLLKETKDLLEGVNEGASRSQHIVKGLRTFSRLDENEFKGVNIHEGIDSTLLLLSNKLKDRINVHKNYGAIPLVEGLPGKLNQVFMNILTNGIMAIKGEGEITITTEQVDDHVQISIKDSGEGMTGEVSEHIFEPFFTTRAVGQGTGLGLSITYSIIEEHHGTIQVNSAPGKGAEFIITIPINRNEEQSS